MKTHILHTPTCILSVCGKKARNSLLLRLFIVAVILASSLMFHQTARADGDVWHASGTGWYRLNKDGDLMELKDGPLPTTFIFKKNDWLILSTEASVNPNYVPFDTFSALAPATRIVTRMDMFVGMNGAKDSMNIYYDISPYKNLRNMMPDSLIPWFTTRSDPVYLQGTLGQDAESTPSPYNSLTTNPVNVWPFSIVSSDSLDAKGNFRMDMQNAAWTVLTYAPTVSKGTNHSLISIYGDYSTSPYLKGNTWSVNLEHVIFTGGYANQGGGLKVLGGLSPQNSTFPTVVIKGDVAFINNNSTGSSTSNGGGGMYVNGQSVQFANKAIFIGNSCGAVMSNDFDNGLVFNQGSALNGSGGGLRVYTGGNNLTFLDESYFIGNLAGGFGGGAAIPTAGMVTFSGKTVFMGNRSGLFISMASSTDGGGGGLSGLNGQGTFYFNNEAYFIGNKAGAAGGGLYGGNSSGNMVFRGNALFTDNSAGVVPTEGTVYVIIPEKGGALPQILSGTTIGQGVYSATTTVGATEWNSPSGQIMTKVGGGGAIWASTGNIAFNKGAKAEFLRNFAYGSGGALGSHGSGNLIDYTGVTNVAAVFYDDAAFVGNYAAVNGGAISVGTLGSWNNNLYNTTSGTNVYLGSVYFTGANSALTVADNVSYWGDSGTKKEVITGVVAKSGATAQTGTSIQYGGGGIFATGGVYVESIYTFRNNQTGGHGGAILVTGYSHTQGNPRPVLTKIGTGTTGYSLILNPLDWAAPGTYSRDGQFALFEKNVSMENGGAIGSLGGAKLYIGSGAQFLDNAAGGYGGAIMMGAAPIWSQSSTFTNINSNAGTLEIKARVSDVIFSGNRQRATIDASGVDYNVILDSGNTSITGFSGTGGYMTASGGVPNDIYVGIGSAVNADTTVATIDIDAYEDMKVYFDGGIAMDNSKQKNITLNINTSIDKGTAIGTGTTSVAPILLDNTAPVGLVVFDNASADVEAATTVGSGTLRIQGTSNSLVWGSATSASRDGTKFELKSPATLEANATINAQTIIIGDGATIRVLGSEVGAGTLTFNSGTGITYQGAVNLAGNGAIYAGADDFNTIRINSIAVGDIGHASAQTLSLAKDTSTAASVKLDQVNLSVGLFGGASSDNFSAGSITLANSNTISLTSLSSGTYSIATSAGAIGGSSTFSILYQGNNLLDPSVNRITVSGSVDGNNLVVKYTSNNQVMAWTAGNGNWDVASSNWQGDGGALVGTYGDVAVFGNNAGNNNIALAQNVLTAGMSASGDYTFTGSHGITTDDIAWGGSPAPGSADGAFTKTGANTMVTFANGNNDFKNGMFIQGGTVAVSTSGQLGTTLSKLHFDTTSESDKATLLITGAVRLDAATRLTPQRLNLDAGEVGHLATASTGELTISNNTTTDNGGALNVGDNATLALDAAGNISIFNNTATKGGGLALGNNATANINVEAGKTVMIGLRDNPDLNTAANISGKDSIYGTASSIINKNGAGLLSINSNSSDFAGTINVNAGSLIAGKYSVVGNADSSINVRNQGSLLGGAATFGGNVSMGQGTFLQVGQGKTSVSDSIIFNGNLTLDNVTLLYGGAISQSRLYTVDLVQAANATLTGTTTFDFKRIANGVNTLINSSNSIATEYLAALAPSLVNGLAVVSATIVVSESGTTVYGTLPAAGGDAFVITKDGQMIDPKRYEAYVSYAMSNAVVSSTTVNGVTTTVIETTYDTTKLVMDSMVHNQKAYWTGTGGNAWGVSARSWDMPDVPTDFTFADGDSVVFGAGDYAGAGLSGNTITINIDDLGVAVADMTVTGSNNWVFKGGLLQSNAGGNDYKDADGKDISQGNLLLDENFSGKVELNTLQARFRGIFTDSVLSDGIVILGGTLQSSAEVISGNNITNNSTLVFDQQSGGIFVGTVHGTGDVVKQGPGDLTVNDTGNLIATTLTVTGGRLLVKTFGGVDIKDAIYVRSGASIIVNDTLNAGTLYNAGLLYRDEGGNLLFGQKAATNNSLLEQGFTAKSSEAPLPKSGPNTYRLLGNYVGEGGLILLNTYRDGVFCDNVVVEGNSSGTSFVVLRNIMSMPNADVANVQFVRGTDTTPGTLMSTSGSNMTAIIQSGKNHANPAGESLSVNAPAPKRHTLIFKTLGPQKDLKLVMDWADSYLPVAFDYYTGTATYATGTNADGTDALKTISFVISGTCTDGQDVGNRSFFLTGTTDASGDIITTGTDFRGKRFSATGIEHHVVEETKEPTTNYILVQGTDYNWYFRNINAQLQAEDLPHIAATPMAADLIAQAGIKAIYQRINARHDKLEAGYNLWTNYVHSEDRIRVDAYNGTMLKQDVFHVGGDYTFAGGDGSAAPSFSLGGAFAFVTGEAKALNASKLSVTANILSAYASARWRCLYLDMIAEYSPKASYKSDTTDPFDLNGTVKGSRLGTSAEFGVITNPIGGGQLEIYGQIASQKHSFDDVSSIGDMPWFNTPEGYNSVYSPNRSNGRPYYFDSPTTLRGELGFRWGSNLKVTNDIIVRPWGGLAYGRNIKNDYFVYVEDHDFLNDIDIVKDMRVDMRGNFYTFRGGAAAQWRKGFQLYLTLEWTGGAPVNNYTLMSGASYRW